MINQSSMLSKTLVIVVILLFIVMSITPSIAVDTVNIENGNGKSSSDDTDWWPMFRHDLQHSGFSTSDAPDTNDVLWSYNIGDRIRSSPAVVDGRVYIGSSDDFVYCLDAITGDYIWSYITNGDVGSSPAVVDGKIYVGSSDHNAYCLDANTGDFIWSYETESSVGSSAVADGKIYVGSFYNVYCLDANTGDYIWSYETGGWVYSDPAVANGKVYIGSFDGYVYAFEKFDSNASSAPEIDGPSKGEPDYDLCFTFHSIDPDGDDVRYVIDWGDRYPSMTDFYPSGTDVKVEHFWLEEGTYNITAKAKDIHGYEGPEGLTLTVIIPRNRATIDSLFQLFFDRFPLLEVFLRAMNLLR